MPSATAIYWENLVPFPQQSAPKLASHHMGLGGSVTAICIDLHSKELDEKRNFGYNGQYADVDVLAGREVGNATAKW